jgi:hypothetical protein
VSRVPGFEIVSDLAADAAAVWRHAVSPAGINRELRPLLRMTFPAGVTDVVASWRPGAPPVRSWMLLGGVLPVEYDDLSFAAVEPGRRFLERSALLSQRVWEHERLIEPAAGGCRVTDRLRFEPRVAVMAAISAAVVGAVFRLRHRNLRRVFGGVV